MTGDGSDPRVLSMVLGATAVVAGMVALLALINGKARYAVRHRHGRADARPGVGRGAHPGGAGGGQRGARDGLRAAG
ncbi:hypothetical protein G5V59_21540 [Nocardioides sp. W3-2-3]|uniref:hypothetical protein n=1 Tax=Nocardioides convexus TaxID=2712224 RepID=UPI0024185E53|nr:hypothetical protein [Nocardioides convexus]NHA01506.1 hypothetical protein [Nocardioides convexus]